MEKSEEGLKNLLMKVKEESEIAGLKLNILYGLWQPGVMGCGGRWEGHTGWEDICMPVANSHWCIAKTTTIL